MSGPEGTPNGVDRLADLAHCTRRMLQALDGYWMWCDGWQGPSNRWPRSRSTAEDWWNRFEMYRSRVESLARLAPPADDQENSGA